MIINRVKIYSNLIGEKTPELEKNHLSQTIAESLGNKHSTICCILNSPSPLLESKDYKTLVKVFEKLMLKIENVYTINVKDSKSMNFIHFIHEYQFTKIFIFGEDALVSNIPVVLEKFKPVPYELCEILLTENLTKLTQSKDESLKRSTWESIKEFYKTI